MTTEHLTSNEQLAEYIMNKVLHVTAFDSKTIDVPVGMARQIANALRATSPPPDCPLLHEPQMRLGRKFCCECGTALTKSVAPDWRDCRHPSLRDDPQQPGVNDYICTVCGARVRVNEFETRGSVDEQRA